MNYLRSFRPFSLILTFLALAALAVSAMYDGLPPVSANSYAGPAGSPHELNWVAALSAQDELDIRGAVLPALADFVIETLAVNTPVVLGKTIDVDVAVRNNGNTPTAGYNLVFYFTDDGEATRIAAETSSADSGPYEGVGAGDPDSLSLTVEVPGTGTLPVGAYDLCAQIRATDSESNSTEVGNSKCDPVFALPDMGDEFPEPIQPVDYKSTPDPEWSIGNCVPTDFWTLVNEGAIPNLPAMVVPASGTARTINEVAKDFSALEYEAPTEDETYWIFAPTEYTNEQATKEIHDGTYGALSIGAQEDYSKRVEAYKELALGLAIREARSDEVYKLQVADNVAGGLKAAELVNLGIDAAAVLSLADVSHILAHNLNFLQSSGLFEGLQIGAPVVDALFSAAANRTIEMKQATETLVMLKELPMDSAWAAGVDCAWVELHIMNSGEFMDKWALELERRQFEIATAIAAVATKQLVAVGTKMLVGHAAVASAPISLTVGLIILEIKETIDQTNEFWYNLGLSAVATQAIPHIYSLPESNDPESNEFKKQTLDYAKFLFYRHLQKAALVDAEKHGLSNLGPNKPQDRLFEITERRDTALTEIIDTTWSPDKDINHLLHGDTAVAPFLTGPFSSDGETAWIGIEGNDLDMRGDQNWLLSYDLEDGSDNYRRIGFSGDIYGPKGLWVDETTDTMWFTHDFAGSEDIFVYATGTRLLIRDRDKEFDYTISSILERSGNESPRGIWSDRETIWVADSSDAKIYAYNFSNGSRKEQGDFNSLKEAGNESPHGIWSDGSTMWVADSGDGKVYAYDMQSKERDPGRDIETVRIPNVADNRPLGGIWADEETMWVLDLSGKLFAYDMIGKPRNVEAELTPVSGSQHIDLDWDRPRSGGGSDITGYIVQAAKEGEAWSTVSGNTGPTATRYAHPDLEAGTTYRYRVAAISEDRLGFWSDVATATTRPGPEIAYLSCYPRRALVGRDVKCSPRLAGDDTSGYTYNWTARAGAVGDPWQGDGPEFTTKWSSPGNRSINLMVCDPIVSGCSSSRREIEVVANTAPEVTLESPDQFWRVQTGVPREFIVSAYDPDGNFESWEWYVNGVRQGGEDPIPDNRFPTFYHVRAAASFSYAFPSTDSYEVKVVFTDGEGATGTANWNVYATSPSSPRAPTIADIIMTEDGSSFSALWDPPASTGEGTPTSYDLRYAEYADSSSPTWTTVTGAWRTGFPLRATVRDLSGGDTAEYDVQVRAVYGGTTGSWSSTFIAAPQSEVLMTDFASEFALSGFAPTDTTLDVRLLPGETRSDLPRLEITIFDEDGMSNRAETESDSDSENSVLGPGSVTVAVPKETWVAYGESTLEIYMNGRWLTYSPAVERTLVAAETLGLGLTGFITGRSLMPGLFGISRSLGVFQDWQAAGEAESDIDEVFGEDYLNCFHQVSRSWRVPVGLPGALLNALAGDFGVTKGVRVTIPVSLSDEDYASLAASFIASETGEGESALVHVPNLLGASGTTSCQPPAVGTE